MHLITGPYLVHGLGIGGVAVVNQLADQLHNRTRSSSKADSLRQEPVHPQPLTIATEPRETTTKYTKYTKRAKVGKPLMNHSPFVYFDYFVVEKTNR